MDFVLLCFAIHTSFQSYVYTIKSNIKSNFLKQGIAYVVAQADVIVLLVNLVISAF